MDRVLVTGGSGFIGSNVIEALSKSCKVINFDLVPSSTKTSHEEIIGDIRDKELVEKVIDKGSKDMLRCLEIVSGSPLTEEELNVTKKSKANTQCPDIANPYYIPN